MKRKIIWIIILILLPIILILTLFVNNFIVFNNIYYQISYETNILNSNEIIVKAETFEYHQYLKMHDPYGITQNITKFNQSLYQFNYINSDYVDFIKDKIDQDRKRFHWWPFYYHHFNYKFNATEQSKLYFSYSNTTLFNATYESMKEVFTVEYDEYYGNFMGNWYINFTHVPKVFNQSYTLLLNNTILIRMFTDYDYTYGNLGAETYHIKQYIALSSDLQVIFVYVPLVQFMVA